MKYFDWNTEKNEQLKTECDVSFEDVIIAIEEGKLFDIIKSAVTLYITALFFCPALSPRSG